MTKTAFVYSGEGAKGAYQAGIALWLDKVGIRPDAAYGSSSGALNAVGHAYVGPLGLMSIWRNIRSINDVFSFNWKFLWSNGLYSPAPLRKLLDRAFNGTIAKFPATVTVVDAEQGTLEYHSTNECDSLHFREFVIGAVTIPAVVNPETKYIDGASATDAPLQRAIDDGCDRIIVLLATPPIAHASMGAPLLKFRNTPLLGFINYGSRFIELLLNQVLFADLRVCTEKNEDPKYKKIDIRIFGPQGYLFDPLDFSQSADAFSQGYNEFVEWKYQDGVWVANSPKVGLMANS